MERADWLDERVDPADARFLMVTAITHHRFNSPIWGSREVRKLQAELDEITKRAAEILHEHQASIKAPQPPAPTRTAPAGYNAGRSDRKSATPSRRSTWRSAGRMARRVSSRYRRG